MYINTFKYTPADVDCKLCTEYVKKFGCTACGCPWMAERIEAGVVGYAEVVRQMFPHDKRLMARLEPLIRDFPGMLWKDERHRQRMEGVKIHLGHSKRRDTPAFFAVMFLFTSDEDIYRVSMFFSDNSTYYEAPVPATIGGCISIVLCIIVMFLVGLIVFSHKKKIEN